MQTSDINLPELTGLSEEAQNSIVRLRGFYRSIRFALDSKQPARDNEAISALITGADIAEIKNALLIVFREADFTQAISGVGIPMGSSFAD